MKRTNGIVDQVEILGRAIGLEGSGQIQHRRRAGGFCASKKGRDEMQLQY